MTDHVITIDFETYYGQYYSLAKLSTAEYVFSDWFEVIGVAYKLDDGDPVWVAATNPHALDELIDLPWKKATMVAHNAAFDGLIAAHHFNIIPKRYFCTAAAGRPAVAHLTGGVSLAAMAEHFGIGVKGTEVVNAKGKHLGDFTAEELDAYGQYCINDVVLTHHLYHLMSAWFERVKNVA